MRPKRQLNKGWIVRPFLGISKMMIQEYAIEHHLVWCIDPTNEEIDYTRNYLRNSLIPQLEERFLSVKKQIIKTQTFCSYSQEAMLHWMEPYFISKTQLAWSEYPDQSKAGLFTLISTWLNFFHYEHPSLKAVECFIEQLLSGKGGQLCIQDKTLLNYNGRLFVESTSDLLRDPPEKKKIFFESGLIKWGIYHVVHKQDFLPQLIEIRRLNKNDTLVLPNRKKIKAQNFWNQYNIPPWKRKWLPAIFSEKIFLQYYTYCYNGELFQEQPFDIS
jgi:tRNA(Ile)-lysidine synthase